MRTVYIVGGGPSLKGFDFDRLRGRAVVAINRAYEDLPEAQVVWFGDWQFFVDHRAGLEAHRGAKFALWTKVMQYPDWVRTFHSTGKRGFDLKPGCIRDGNNSFYAAIHAVAKEAHPDRIVALGLDMKYGPNGESHYHGGYGKTHHERTLAEKMLPYFESLKRPLDRLRIEVLNANPDSALEIWPRVRIEEVL